MFHVKHPSSSLLVLFRWCISLPLFLTPYRAVSLSFFCFTWNIRKILNLSKITITNFGFNFFNVNTDHVNLLHHQPSLPEMFHVKQSNDSPLSPLTPSSLTLLFFSYTCNHTWKYLSLAIHKLLCQFVIEFLLSNTSH